MTQILESAKDVPQGAIGISLLQREDEITAFTAWLKLWQPARILEIGAHQGGTAILWCGIAKELVVSVDLPGGDGGGLSLADCEMRNALLSRSYPQFRGVLGDSHSRDTHRIVAELLNGDSVDLLFIDGDHTYDGVRSDFEMYYGLVRDGGWIAFHDINDTEAHRKAGCRVDLFWMELLGEKFEFNAHGQWGGIGVIRV